MKKILLYSVSFLMLCAFEGFAQTIITGTVKDRSGETLPGVSVKLKGTSIGANTNTTGSYSIPVSDGNGVLIFSFIGMQNQEVEISGRKVIDVTLLASLESLQEVVVIGYGSQSRETITTSVSKLDTKVLANVPFSNVASALQGTLSGVRVQTTSGMPGSGPRIIIRGGTSINNPDGAGPLYVVDGVIRSNINTIDQSDVESLQVLKDAAATSIYGARASNGVVIITTKSGKSGKAVIDYKYDLTISDNVEEYDLLSARDYIQFQRLGIYRSATWGNKPAQLAILSSASSAGTGNDLTKNTAYTTQYLNAQNQHKLNEGWQSMPDPIDPTKTIIFDDFDFQNNIYRTGISGNHSISASGGTDKGSFSAGLGYLNNDGIVITTNFKRLNGHINGDFNIKDNLKVFGRLIYSNSQDNNPTSEATFGRSIGLPPTAKYKFEDGTLAPGASSSLGNSEYLLNTVDRRNVGDDLTVAFGAQWKILPGLTFDPQVSLWQVTGDARSFQRAFWNGPLSYVTTRAASSSNSKSLQKQADGVFTYIKSLKDDHNFEAKAGFSYYSTFSSSLSGNGRDAATDLIPTLNASALPVSISSAESEQLIFGYFGRINYDFKQKYLLSVNARYDGASNLGEAYKWGLFPGISLGWNVHKERFWSGLPENLLKLKLRASYGVNGNISGLGPYTAQGQYNVGVRYGGSAAVQNTVIANSELQWEQSKTLDFGLDLGVFNNRVNVVFDVYRRVTDNLLASLSMPHSTGFSSTLTNAGSLENKGVELELNTRIMPGTSNFQWDLGFNVARVSNKILKLPYNGIKNNRIGGVEVWDSKTNSYVWKGGLQEGGTMGDYYTYNMLGVYATDAEAANAPLDNLTPIADKKVYGGDAIIADLDGNKILDTRDQVYAGNMYPKWTGGFSNSFSYKNMGLYIRTDFTAGQTIFNYTNLTMIAQLQGDNGLSKELLQSWQKPGDVSELPVFVYADQQVRNKLYRGAAGTTRFYEKGDFLAIRELTFTYDVPKALLQKAKISALRFNVTGHNLHYFTKYSGLNPEYGGQDNGRYPIPRNIIFGLNVTL
ncbi:TonB-dependent receptor [Daejeonella sp. JGW-45]|uniref:SusC/RagA family TonB-linked outer membrane protein n=1 Tax=Daejeonella sp. JGW-45 TaxID=3034148 RepID=UPI0023EBD97E|nr:TonB-dependent receptor [Daejeonella sp. JGW-45]